MTISITNPPHCRVLIGKMGENKYTPIQIDVSEWLTAYPGGLCSVIFSRPDGQIYPVVENATTSPITWLPTDTDLACGGRGQIEVRISLGDMLGKSKLIETYTNDSLHSGEVPPDAVLEWVQKILDITGHVPTIGENGNWFVWNTLTGAYADTGNPAKGGIGPQGIQGIQGLVGLTGATGNGIASLVRTSGTGAPGTSDTYTITFTDSTTATFGVWNGTNGVTIVNDLTTGGADKAASAEMAKQLSASISELQLKGSIVSDTTFNAAWISGTPTIDYTTGVITLASHGLVANDAIEFDAGTGVLPTGILPYNSDEIGGTYYNVLYLDANTFKITATVGGSTAVLPTDNGTSGWRVRLAYVAVSVTGLNLAAHKEYDVFCFASFIKKTTAATSYYPKFNSVYYKHFSGVAWGGLTVDSTPAITRKYSVGLMNMNIRWIDTTKLLFTCTFKGQESNDKSTAANLTLESGAYVNNTANITSLYIASNASAATLCRNGTRLVVARRG